MRFFKNAFYKFTTLTILNPHKNTCISKNQLSASAFDHVASEEKIEQFLVHMYFAFSCYALKSIPFLIDIPTGGRRVTCVWECVWQCAARDKGPPAQ